MSNADPPADLRTARLLLRPMTRADVDVIAAMQTDPAVMAHYGNGQPLSRTAAAETVLNYHIHCRQHGYWAWAVTGRESGEVFGQVTAAVDGMGGPGSVGLGFILKQDAWGFGYGPEAVHAVVEHGLTVLAWPGVAAGVSPANVRSIRLCERIGMTAMRDELNSHGRQRRVYVMERNSATKI